MITADRNSEMNLDMTEKPDENTGLVIEDFLLISDPETGRIISQGQVHDEK